MAPKGMKKTAVPKARPAPKKAAAKKKAAEAKAAPKKKAAEAKNVADRQPAQDVLERMCSAAQETFSSSEDEGDTPAGRTRLERRESEEQAERAVEGRLGHLPSQSWKMLRNENNESIFDVARDYISRRRPKKVRLSTRFFEGIFRSFGLTDKMVAVLEVPEDEETLDPKLDDALDWLHHKDPTKRTSKPLCRLLEYCGPLNRYEWYGLLTNVLESEQVPKARAMACQLAALKHAQKTQMWVAHRDYWTCFKAHFDQAMKFDWEEQSATGVDADTWVLLNLAIFSMWSSTDDLQKVMACEKDYGSVAESVRAIVKGSETGKSVYKSEWLQASRRLFQNEAGKSLHDLERSDFDEDSVDLWKQDMLNACADLQSIGHNLWQKSSRELQFLNRPIECECEATNDEWEFPFQARIRTIGINNGQLKPLPWEEMLIDFSEGLPGVPRELQLPPVLLAKASAVRAKMLQWATANGETTISGWQEAVAQKEDALKKMDRSIECEVAWLQQQAEELAELRSKEAVLASMPSEERTMSFDMCIAKLQKLMGFQARALQ